MHQTGAPIGVTQGLDAIADLRLVLGGRRTHDQAHRPNIVKSDVRATDTFRCLALEEIGIVPAPYQTTGVLIDRIVNGYTAQERQCQEARHIGIVHEDTCPKAIHLIRIDLAELRMLHDRVLLHSLFHLRSQRLAASRQVVVLSHRAQNLRCLTQRGDGEQVGRNQEAEQRSVVRGTERREDQTNRIDRCAPTVVQHRITLPIRHTLEAIRALVLLALLLPEGAINGLHRLLPIGIKHRGIAQLFPIVVSQTNRVTQGINLPFTLVQLLLHLRAILLPLAARRALVESVRIGINQDAGRLAIDRADQHLLQFFILLGQHDIGIDLRRTVAQPHGVNIARDHEGIGFSVHHLELASRVQGVRIAVLKHPSQFRILDAGLHRLDLLLHRFRGKLTSLRSRTLRREVTRHLSRQFTVALPVLGRGSPPCQQLLTNHQSR